VCACAFVGGWVVVLLCCVFSAARGSCASGDVCAVCAASATCIYGLCVCARARVMLVVCMCGYACGARYCHEQGNCSKNLCRRGEREGRLCV